MINLFCKALTMSRKLRDGTLTNQGEGMEDIFYPFRGRKMEKKRDFQEDVLFSLKC